MLFLPFFYENGQRQEFEQGEEKQEHMMRRNLHNDRFIFGRYFYCGRGYN